MPTRRQKGVHPLRNTQTVPKLREVRSSAFLSCFVLRKCLLRLLALSFISQKGQAGSDSIYGRGPDLGIGLHELVVRHGVEIFGLFERLRLRVQLHHVGNPIRDLPRAKSFSAAP